MYFIDIKSFAGLIEDMSYTEIISIFSQSESHRIFFFEIWLFVMLVKYVTYYMSYEKAVLILAKN